MKKYRVYAIATASCFLGEFEAENKDEAIRKAQEEGDYASSLCHQCSHDVELGDWYKEEAEEI